MTDQADLPLDYTARELLESHEYAEPLVAGGVRCHGGFLADGTYTSPRTKNRVPAIQAWQAAHRMRFGTELLDLPLETWPGHYPNLAQARFLIASGAPEPIISTLTRIGTVEGFGGMIRYSFLPNLRACFEEEIDGTAMLHLERGLYEAHARDEAGHGGEGGHNVMWFAARDIAFENPVTEDETALMLERMGIATSGSGGTVDVSKMRDIAFANRLWPDDLEFEFEMTVERMVRLLLIEISAFHAFAWAESLLSDTDLVAGDGEAARLVSYIRSDETPHVEYLKAVLTEMRDRTFAGSSGARYPGGEMIGKIWDRALAESLGPRRDDMVATTRREIAHALSGRTDGADVMAEFDSLATLPEAA